VEGSRNEGKEPYQRIGGHWYQGSPLLDGLFLRTFDDEAAVVRGSGAFSLLS